MLKKIALNDYFEEPDIECLESDVGEYIVQLTKEHTYRIINDGHSSKQETSGGLICQQYWCFEHTVDVLIGQGRRVLREKFCKANVGITGVNFAVAKTDTLCLIENEGIDRMCNAVPDLHIVITGIKKVVAFVDNVAWLLSLLTGSAKTAYIHLFYYDQLTA